jgi:hypothetical protein
VKKLSTGGLVVERVVLPILWVGFLIVGLISLPLPGVLTLLMGTIGLVYWWRVARKLVHVSMDENGLFILRKAGHKEVFIPFGQIFVVRRVGWVARRKVLVAYRNEAGVMAEAVFKPPVQFSWDDEVVNLLRTKSGLTAT